MGGVSRWSLGRRIVCEEPRSPGRYSARARAGSLLSENLSERAAFCSARRSGRDGPSRRLTLGALGRPSARAAAPAAAPAAAAVGNSIGLGQPPRTRRRTTSATRRRLGRAIATLVTTFTQTRTVSTPRPSPIIGPSICERAGRERPASIVAASAATVRNSTPSAL